MGADGRSWTALFSLLALAILMAFVGPEPATEPDVADLVEVDEVEALTPTVSTVVVASR